MKEALAIALVIAAFADCYFLAVTADATWLLFALLHGFAAYVLSYEPERPPRD